MGSVLFARKTEDFDARPDNTVCLRLNNSVQDSFPPIWVQPAAYEQEKMKEMVKLVNVLQIIVKQTS